MRVFRDIEYEAQCEACKRPFNASHGGVCTQCRRMLCDAHLYGSFTRKLWLNLGFGGSAVCTACRDR